MTLKFKPHQQRSLDAMLANDTGQIIVPTGGGKTIIMMEDLLRDIDLGQRLTNITSTVSVIVAPRILLAQQLCDDLICHSNQRKNFNKNRIQIVHVHSGRTKFRTTTKPDDINDIVMLNQLHDRHTVLFATYHSLKRIVDSGIQVDNIYYDEAHNSTARSFFISVQAMVKKAGRSYYFTATPKHSYRHERGMNNAEVYGTIIEDVPAPELVDGGSILPPTVIPFEKEHPIEYNKQNSHIHHSLTVKDVIDGVVKGDAKILVTVPSSKILNNMLGQTTLLKALADRGYDVLHITSKFGAYVNKTKVNRTKFFETLKKWSQEAGRKFVLFHYSILSEGINVNGLTHTIFLRNLNVIEMAQSIGRVIRLDKCDSQDIASGAIPAGVLSLYRKRTGYCVIPTNKNYGSHTIRRIQRIVDDIFVDGKFSTGLC